MRPAWLEIDLGALRDNVRSVSRLVGPRARVIAVVKANGYGHGLAESACAALAGGAEILAVALVEEAVALRAAGLDAPILVLGAPLPDCAADIVDADVSQVVSERAAVRALSRAAVDRRRNVGLHLKIDTGMARVGVAPHAAVAMALEIAALPGVALEGICTHFATADEDPLPVRAQDAAFRDVLRRFDAEGLVPGLRHAANSGAVQLGRETDYDFVRAGLLTYGCPPYPDRAPDLRPALTWKSRIVQIRRHPAGAGVGYGLTARLGQPSRLAIVPLGYADGWPRALSNRGRVLVHGEWAPVVGRVSMDQFTIDVTAVPGVELGDEVVLIGGQGERRQTVDDVARDAGTNAHDVLAGLGPRLPRIYQ